MDLSSILSIIDINNTLISVGFSGEYAAGIILGFPTWWRLQKTTFRRLKHRRHLRVMSTVLIFDVTSCVLNATRLETRERFQHK